MGSTSKLRALAANLTLAVGTLLVVFGGAEWASRWLHPVPLPAPVHAVDLAPDELLFFGLHPNRPRPVWTNSLGLRGPEVPPKSDGEFRILSLGESTTYGWDVAYEQAYSALLEERLGTVDGRAVRVVNAGVPAYTSFQGLTYLEHRGLDLAPDAVLVYFAANDTTPVSFRTSRTTAWNEDGGLTDRELFALRQKPWVRVSSALFRHSNLYRALVTRGGDLDAPPAPSKRPRVSRRERLEILLAFRDLCAEHGIRLAVLIPWYREFDGHLEPMRWLASQDVPTVDLPARLAHLDEEKPRYFLDAIHPNARGHEVVADAIEAGLRELWSPPGASGSAD